MKVTLINYTANAKELLIFTKQTRLKMSPNGFKEILDFSEEAKQKELEYVFGTIGSGLEFCDYIFMIEDVTRAFTHQLVRHRVGTSFAQQSQRTINASGFRYLSTGDCKDNAVYELGMQEISKRYDQLLNRGIKPEDARGLLPTNILTNIMLKINLRALIEMVEKRLCIRTQGEFQDVAKEMIHEVLKVHPWLKEQLRVYCVKHLDCPWKNFKDCPVKNDFFDFDHEELAEEIQNSINRMERPIGNIRNT